MSGHPGKEKNHVLESGNGKTGSRKSGNSLAIVFSGRSDDSYIRLTDPDALNELRDLGCLTVVDARTQEEKLDIKGDLVALNYRERGRGYLDLVPVWSPDSRFVYFHYDDPAWESIGPRWSLYRADMTTGQVIRMPFPIEEYRINTIEVSPSGKRIALNSRQRWKPYEKRFSGRRQNA